MKRVFVIVLGLLAMMMASLSMKAQDISVTLIPGWTWIGFPKTEAMNIADALGDFAPSEGDLIRSKYGTARYHNGVWRGNLQRLTPGLGYMYYNNRAEPVNLVFVLTAPQSQVTVTTSEPLLITAVSAMGGGEVTTEDGVYILAKGICWATHENPTTNEDAFADAGSGMGSFSASMTGLNISTTYYVRAYAVTADGTTYGDQKTFTTRDGIPEVSTAEVTNISYHSATCGGIVTDDGGLNVNRGVCWSTLHNPTISDNYTTNGVGVGSFSSRITGLALSTTYYVRAYATTSQVTVYGEEMDFTTPNDYAYVDLGLPSGTLWATCNVGSETPEEYGDYFAWGETQPKANYDWSTYQYCNGSSSTLTKYTAFDGLTTLLPEDDAATVNWGENWRMPSDEEWQELLDNTTHIWTTQNGVNGQLFTASNGYSLFLPAAGYRLYSVLYMSGIYGEYWSNSIGSIYYAHRFNFSSNGCVVGSDRSRNYGNSVRAVRSIQPGTTSYSITVTSSPTSGGMLTGGGTYQLGQTCTVIATANTGYTFVNWTENDSVVSNDASYSFIVSENRALVANFTYSGGTNHEYVDLGLPSGTLWATCNVGADAPEDYGDYFAWGETQPKQTYTWESYIFAEGTSLEDPQLTKYCNNPSYGYNNFTDNLTTLLPEDDAATANWGSDWRMPTQAEWQELYQNTTHIWTTQNGVDGRLFTASNGYSLFLPADGWRYDNSLNNPGSSGNYWSSSLNAGNPNYAWGFGFNPGNYGTSYDHRFIGFTVRPVRSSR